jgi:site-specific recombinase XerD
MATRIRASPHALRPSASVRLPRVGADISPIRAWWAHASLKTINCYICIDLERKGRVLETGVPRAAGKGSDHEMPMR